ncbi:MAG: DsbA family protein [Stackebrandtia sp.]
MTMPPPPPQPNQWGPTPPPSEPWQQFPPPPPPPRQSHVALFVVLGVIGVLLIGAAVWGGLALVGASKDKVDQQTAVAEPKAEVSKGGIVLGEGKAEVEIYLDFICPACGRFQLENGPALETAIEDGKATVIMHPLNFLEGASTTDYSSRAAGASVCAADEGEFFPYYQALMNEQPPEGGEGLSDDELTEFGADLGFGKGFADCVVDGEYRGWVDEMTDKALSDGIEATPTITVDGKGVEATEFPQEFQQAIGSDKGD